MARIIGIGLGGFLGAISRYLITNKVENLFQGTFPYGTLTVNLLGCFLLGFIFTLTLNHELINPQLRIAITTGFLGALTTFSTFSYETIALLREESLLLAFTNILISLLPGLVMVWLGITLAKLI